MFDNQESGIHRLETGRVVTRLVYPRRGMVNTSVYACTPSEMTQIMKKPAVEWIAL